MIGVTVGVGCYLSLARQAAELMVRRTGIECVVLTDEHYSRAGLTGQPPHLLKLHLWDFVTADEVLWFDADTQCLEDWDPTGFADDHAVVAVRDWIWRDGIQGEARRAEVPLEDYFLSSVMLLNRQTHEPMLKLARLLYPEIESQVFEQTALNAARCRLGIPIRFLDRRYNWSLFGIGDLHRQADCIVAHFNDPSLRDNPQLIQQTAAEAPGQIDATAFSRLGNRFHRYVRVGYDERPIYLRSDGTVGHGGGMVERFWYVKQTAGRSVLVIGSETCTTCELTLGPDDTWHGQWLDYERMPVFLAPYHGQMLLDLLSPRMGDLRGAEIGVFRGHLSAQLLTALPRLTLWLVDLWRSPKPGEHLWDDPHLRHIDDERMTAALANTLSSTDFARDRRFVLISDLTAAAMYVPDGSLDFVFLDADHSWEGTFEALQVWSAKVRPGGLVAGHDLDYPDYPGVRQAVEQYCADHDLNWQSAPDYVWWFETPLNHTDETGDNAVRESCIGDRMGQSENDWSSIARSTLNVSSESTLNAMAGKFYRYLRVGHDERPLYFTADGSIGFGCGGAERLWNLQKTPHGTTLTISSDTALTCELTETAPERWEGCWLDYERMPILVTPHRGQVLLDLLGDRTRRWRGAEIGVFEGHTSALLLQALPHLQLLMVDAWISPKVGDSLFADPYMSQVTPAQMQLALNSSLSRTDFARERRTIVMADLVAAADCVQDQTLDFVFLDADHSKAGTLDAIRAWTRKVVPGGIVAGHDLDHLDFPGVREAVEEFTQERRWVWHCGADFVWWFKVPNPQPAAQTSFVRSERAAMEIAGS